MIKKLWSWFVEIVKETLNLSWTLVGLVIATLTLTGSAQQITGLATIITLGIWLVTINCLLYTSPSPRDATLSRMPSSA